MHGFQKFLSGSVLFASALALVLVPQRAASSSLQDMAGLNMAQSRADEPVPAYHTRAPKGELPATMSPELFYDPVVQNAYTVAARIKKILYQQPCYCHCDRSQGHGSLVDCFASKHGSSCNICISEDLYSYEQSLKGKSAAQIRAGIIKGEWRSLDATKYERPLPAK